ncbi:nitroreductase family protein [Bradyrhizobium sp. LA2.1]|uniref:Acg family FMN-binding oxidoreductase n=1 Tax=Bradyrhizobium sp. LA2.1 TaxID=3156376 RepID=UPI003391FAED
MKNLSRRQCLLGSGGVLVVAGVIGATAWNRNSGASAMADYDNYVATLRTALGPEAGLSNLIRYATLAANGHNTQPWRFQVRGNDVRLLPDFGRRTPIVDPDDHHLFVSLGCAAENLFVAARAAGRSCEVASEPDGSLRFQLGTGTVSRDPVFDVIAKRQSTRALYDGRPVPGRDLDALARAGTRPGVRLFLLTDRQQMDKVRELAIAGNNVQLADPAFVAELKSWLRFNPSAAMTSGDGLFAASTGNPVLPDWIGRRAFDLFFTARTENDKLARELESSAALAVFVGDAADPANWIEVGRACQRFLLTATWLGLKCAFINQPVEVARLRPELAALIGEPHKRPDLVVRFGYGPAMLYAPRRPVDTVLV